MSRVRHTETFEVAQPAKRLFPLFSPEGETRWVPGWTYENVMGTSDLHENYVFLTKAHDHSSTEAVWIVNRYEPGDYLVRFYKVEAGDKVGIVTVQCFQKGDALTHVEVTYEYIGLSERGDEFIRGFTTEAYREFIAEWKILLEDYFRRADS